MFRNILLAVDLDAPNSWMRALVLAEALVRAFDGRLTLCTIVKDWTLAREAQWSPIAYRDVVEAARVRLLEIAPSMPAAGVEVGTGPVHSAVLDIADRVGADLIMLSSRPPGVSDRVRGSNARRIAGRARQSVLVVREPDRAASG